MTLKICICGVKKYPHLVWMAFVESEEECVKEEEIRKHFGEAVCDAMDVPKRIVFMPTSEDTLVVSQ
jgi:hypothetical protein